MELKRMLMRGSAVITLSAVLVSCIFAGNNTPYVFAAEDTQETAVVETTDDTEALDTTAAEEVKEQTEVSEDASVENTGEADTKLTATQKKWLDRVMVKVNDSLCVRAEASKDAAIVGKMYPTSVATVIKVGDGWTRIKSGNVKGYIKNSYCLYGLDAYENWKEVCYKVATVTSSTLNVREKANTSATILKVAVKGAQLKYLKKVDEDWIKVSYGSVKGYVYSKYVDVAYNTTTAKSIEEIAAEKKAAEEAAAKAANAYAATADETTLLAAIIQCEAGSEPYNGQVAVGAVVLNRVRSSAYPNSISGVIYQAHQFGPASSGKLSRTISSGGISSSCRRAAEEALAGNDPTGGLLHFNRNNGSGGLVIGNHRFW